MKYAVIDVGSNSVRLMIAQEDKTLYKKCSITRLIEGSGEDHLLKNEAVERTAQAVSFFVEQAKKEGVNDIFVFATAGVRQSKNPQMFIDRVYELCKIKVDVVSGELEGYIGAIGAVGTNGAMLDVGGASIELFVLKNGQKTYAKSIDIGAVRLTQKFGQDKEKVLEFAREQVKQFDYKNLKAITAVGGTITTICAILLQLVIYDANKVHNYKISKKQLQEVIDKLYSLPVERRKNIAGLQPERAEIIPAGAVLVYAFLEHMNLDCVTVSESDNLEGYLTHVLEGK